MKRIITYPVIILSLVSLLTDIASEMLYPVMPVYLKSIGFSIVLIGVLEGCAEAIAGISKGYFGHLSDQSGRRVPFVQGGYFLSSLSKPLMAIFSYPWWVFFARTLDRLGKGLRTSARDALLSDESTKENKGKVFGFHRGMDTLGATIGPILALIFLTIYPGQYKTLFFLAFFPGIASVLFTFLIKEKKKNHEPKHKTYSFFYFFSYWSKSTGPYKFLLIGLLAFTFFNSSDVFLLLMIKERGMGDDQVIKVYIFYNLCYALLSYPLGHMADKFGLKITFMLGLLIFAVVYAGMGISQNIWVFFGLFLLYGLYAAATEGVSKAWLSNIAKKEETATALGLYGALNSLMAIVASSTAGIIWTTLGPQATFLFSAGGVLLVYMYFLFNRKF
jgi:MFS family permease